MMHLLLYKRNKAQAATELAIFGAIVIFIVGAIIRTAVTSGYSQNASLKAMRYAMLQSYESSKAGHTARNTATTLYIEDRLVPDFGKYGILERTPFVAQGNGTFSNMMMYPVDWSDLWENGPKYEHIPTFDMYINGSKFVFTMAAAGEKWIVPPIDNNGSRYQDRYPVNGLPVDVPASGRKKGWNFKCLKSKDPNNANDPIEYWYGCALFYTIVPNIPNGTFCKTDNCEGILTLAERFDLNRNDSFLFSDDPRPTGASTAYITRENMMWQWDAINGLMDAVSPKINAGESMYPSYDFDNDRKEETIFAISPATQEDARLNTALNINPHPNIVRKVKALDMQDGDMDLSRDSISPDGRVGLLQDMAIYTRPTANSSDGTYLIIKEGKMYNPEGQEIVRSKSFLDQVDVIERRIRLSNNTGRMCNAVVNPGIYCADQGGCFSNVNDGNKRTCFDRDQRILYVRTAILNKRGHLWITDAGGELKLPKR